MTDTSGPMPRQPGHNGEAPCPRCGDPAHPAMARRYQGCCSSQCEDVFDARQDAERVKQRLAAVLRVCHESGLALGHPVIEEALAFASENPPENFVTGHFDGVIGALKSEGPDADRCVCCNGPHVYCTFIEANPPQVSTRYRRGDGPLTYAKPQDWLSDEKHWLAKNGYEGRKVRLTLEVLP